MNITATTYILLAVGVLIIIFTFLPFKSSYSEKLRETKQRFKGLGIELEISNHSLFFIVGVALTLVGVFFHLRDYESKITELNKDIQDKTSQNEALQRASAETRRYDVNATLTFKEGEAVYFADPKNLECSYRTWNGDEKVAVEVTPGPVQNSLQMRIKDMQADDMIMAIRVVNKANNSTWSYEKQYRPLQPSFEMQRKTP